MNQSLWRRMSVLAAAAAATVCAAAPAGAQTPDVAASLEESTEQGVQLPYRGSLVTYEHSTRVWGFAGEELTYNPMWVQSLSLIPRWYFRDNLWARFRLDMEQELTNADDSTLAHELRVTGTTLDFNYDQIPLVENLTAGSRLTFAFPTDQISQLRTLYLATSLRGALTYSVPSVAQGLLLELGGDFTKYFNRYADGDADVLQYCSGSRGTSEACTSTGVMNPNFRLRYSLTAVLQILDKLAATAAATVYNTWAYDTPDAEVATLSGAVDVPRSGDDTRLRAQNRFQLEVAYDLTKYFNLAVGADTWTGQLADDGTYRNPFFNRFTNFYVDLNLTVDELVKVVSPSATASLGPRTALRSE